ncbi:MAG: T9SS type A sorting domain-containing protein [Chitinispirillia bacterium]|jgi:hypothetical protein
MKRFFLLILFVIFTKLFISYGVIITSVTDNNNNYFIIATSNAKYYYQKEAGAFSRILDQNNVDWVAYNTKNGQDASSEYRGVPSLSIIDSLGHPGFAKCISTKINDTSILTISKDSLWEWRWDFSEYQASMTMLKTDPGKSYSFMYNGPPHGMYGNTNYWGCDRLGFRPDFSSFLKHDTFGNWQWAYFGDSKKDRIFFIAQHSKDSLQDIFRWINGADSSGIASFGFGKNGSDGLMNSVGNKFTIGFLEQSVADSTTHIQASDVIYKILGNDSICNLFGISVTTHWSSKNENAIMGNWGNIIRHDIDNDSVVSRTILYEGNAFYPKINIEGTQVCFFLRNESKQGASIAVMDIDGNNMKRLDNTTWNVDSIGGYLDWPSGPWIYYLCGVANNEIWRVHADNGIVEKMVTINDRKNRPSHPWVPSFSADGSRMVFRAADFNIYFVNVPETFPEVITLKQTGGEFNSPGGIYGCQHSISASGNYMCFGPPVDEHKTIRIKQWWDTSQSGSVKKFNAEDLHSWKPSQKEMGGIFNYNRWSNNSDSWICAHEASKQGQIEVCNQVLYNWVDKRQVVVTDNDGSTYDFDCAGDLHVDTSNRTNSPIIKLNNYRLNFNADSGLANSMDQSINITNAGGGILSDIKYSPYYTSQKDTGWLDIQKSGTGNLQKLTNKIDISSLTGGNYTAIVSVYSDNANLSRIYSANLKINANRVFSKVQISPEEVELKPGESYLFSAIALDQYSDTLGEQPDKWIWETDSGASIDSGVFISQSEKDMPYSIRVTGIVGNKTLSATATAVVKFPVLTVLKPNGGEEYYMGDTVYILWKAADESKISSVAIELSTNSGRTWNILNTFSIAPDDSAWGKYLWVVSDDLKYFNTRNSILSDSCKIKIRDYQFPAYKDVSDSIFSIKDYKTVNNDKSRAHRKIFQIFQNRPYLFTVFIPHSQNFSINIVTPNGRSIYHKNGTGSCLYSFSREKLASGVYIVRAQADQKVIMKRLLLY